MGQRTDVSILMAKPRFEELSYVDHGKNVTGTFLKLCFGKNDSRAEGATIIGRDCQPGWQKLDTNTFYQFEIGLTYLRCGDRAYDIRKIMKDGEVLWQHRD